MAWAGEGQSMDEDVRRAYTNAVDFLRQLRKHHNRLSRQQIQTLRGQALHGDIIGAYEGLNRLLRREAERYEHR